MVTASLESVTIWLTMLSTSSHSVTRVHNGIRRCTKHSACYSSSSSSRFIDNIITRTGTKEKYIPGENLLSIKKKVRDDLCIIPEHKRNIHITQNTEFRLHFGPMSVHAARLRLKVGPKHSFLVSFGTRLSTYKVSSSYNDTNICAQLQLDATASSCSCKQ